VPTTIGDFLEFEYGKGLTRTKRNGNGKFPVYGSNGIVGYHDNFLIKAPALIIGRKGAAGEVSYSDKNCWPIDTTYFINNLKYLDIKFVFYVLKTLRLNQYDRSTAIPGLNRDDAYEIGFNLPPLPEQHQIVAKIEELFSDLDNGIENLKKSREQLKTYRQAVLKYAFEGKLTKEWRTRQIQEGNPPEPAEKLLGQIRKEREAYYKKQIEDLERACKQAQAKNTKKPAKPKKPKDLPPLTKKELVKLPNLPEGWGWEKLGGIANRIQIGPFGSQLHKTDYTDYGIPIVNPKHIKEQKIHPDEMISEKTASKLPQYLLSENDIILGRRGEMGRSAPITKKENGWFCGTGSLFVRLTSCMDPKLFSLILSEKRIVSNLLKYSRGTTMTNLNSEIMKNLPIQIISSEEQQSIVQEIESRLSVCDQLEQTIEDSLKKADALRQSILKKAFSGKLTKDWREKNPELISGENSAEKLLEQIKAEKEKLQPKKAKKR